MQESASTHLGFLQKATSAILGTGCSMTDTVPTTCPTFFSNDKGKKGLHETHSKLAVCLFFVVVSYELYLQSSSNNE